MDRTDDKDAEMDDKLELHGTERTDGRMGTMRRMGSFNGIVEEIEQMKRKKTWREIRRLSGAERMKL